jgi:hypothetical protein
MHEKSSEVRSDVAAMKSTSRRWWRYSLRTFLVLVTLFCVWLGIVANRAHVQKSAVEKLTQKGMKIGYDYQLSDDHPAWKDDPESHVPTWLLNLTGTDFFHTAKIALTQENNELTDDDLVIFMQLPKLKAVALVKCDKITDRGLQYLAHLDLIETLMLTGNEIDGNELTFLRHPEKLKQLSLNQTNVTDDYAKRIGEMKNLEVLTLTSTKITDAILPAIGSLKRLIYLELEDTNISDDGLKHLAQLKSLERISIGKKTKVTEQGKAWLQTQLPNCEVR